MSRRMFTLLLIMMLSLLLPLTAAAWSLDEIFSFQTIGFVPKTADNIGEQLDAQIMRLMENTDYGRGLLCITMTVPVHLDNVQHSSPLARQMSEELSRFFMERGYRVTEIRKRADILIVPERGEMLLTRERSLLESTDVTSEMILYGTYTITDRSVRFNMKLLHTASREVLAAAAGTVPITVELQPLIADKTVQPPQPLGPTVQTRLPRRAN